MKLKKEHILSMKKMQIFDSVYTQEKRKIEMNKSHGERKIRSGVEPAPKRCVIKSNPTREGEPISQKR